MHTDVSVLVVGAGAAGLAAAVTLGRYGVDVLLVERRAEVSRLPRATVISTRSMEVVRSWGLEGDVRAGGVDAEISLWESETLTRAADGRKLSVGYPTREQAAAISPTAPAAVPQDWLEAVLRRHLETLPTVRVHRGAELQTLESGADGVSASVRGADGRSSTVRAQYVVAADGGRSRVRSLLGVAMRGPDAAMSGAQVVFRAPLWDLLGDLRYALYVVTTTQAPGLFLPAGPQDRWVYAVQEAPNAPPSDLDPVRVAEQIRRGAGVADLPVRIEHAGRFRSPGQLADRFRVGRTFLVGDAAHRVTPRGGTGMNTALQDGFDLGWKLAWVLQGWAGPELLDSYERERRVVAQHNVARSTDLDGSRRPFLDELQVDIGGRIAHAWLPDSSSTSTIDVLGAGWTVLTGPLQDAAAAAATAAAVDAGNGVPVGVQQLDGLTARALGIAAGGGLLVRPDGVPAAMWASDEHAPSARLAAA